MKIFALESEEIDATTEAIFIVDLLNVPPEVKSAQSFPSSADWELEDTEQ